MKRGRDISSSAGAPGHSPGGRLPWRWLARVACTTALAFGSLQCTATPPAAIDRPTLAPDRGRADADRSSGVRGVVLDAHGAPAAGATVMAFIGDDEDDPAPMTRTGRDGSFRFERLPPGSWRFSASSLEGLALAGDAVVIARSDQTFEVRLQLEPATHTLAGSVRDELGGAVRGATITLDEVGDRVGSTFGVIADEHGDWKVGISSDAPFAIGATAPDRRRVYQRVSPNEETSPPVQLGPPPTPAPDPADVAGWLAAEMKPIRTARPGTGTDDLDAVGKMIGSARIVALGEATHGSSEFQTLKHRLLEHLVAHEGVTVFAIEAGVMEALAVDDYVTKNQGNARAALHGLQTFSWETEEMLEIIEWMRRWNADPKHTRKVRFEGFDVTAFSSVRALAAYLAKVDPGVAQNFETAVRPMADPSSDGSYGRLAREEQARTRAALEHVLGRLESRKRAYVERAGQGAWDLAMRQIAAARQAEAVWRDPLSRDAAMAANVEATVARYPAATRVALWMHNSHAAAESGRLFDMGALLRETYQGDYFVLGFAFGRGSFRAFQAGDPKYEVRALAVGEPHPESFDSALGLARVPMFAIDLRTARDEVQGWLGSPLLAWSIGGAFRDERGARIRVRPAEAYDAVVYVDRVTASHPLPKLR